LVLNNNLRWMDVQLALATQDEQADNTIIDGFKTVEKKVEGYTESNVDTLIGDHSPKEHEYLFLDDEKINEEQILSRSKKIFNITNEKNISISKSGEGSEIPMYSVSYRDEDKNAYMDITEQGRHPITILVNRTLQDKKLSLNEGLQKAEKYLEQNDFKDMKIFQSTEYNNIGVYSFLYNDHGVRVHSDSIEVKVGLDN